MLYIISVPIGNVRDITMRAVDMLESVDYLLCEDTRITGTLFNKLGLTNKPRFISYYDENESSRIPEVLSYLRMGKKVGLVSDAGTPLISDPGWLLIRRCQSENLPYTALPGASSIINALVLSGIPLARFSYLGFLPKKKGQRLKILDSYKGIDGAKVCFESPNRLRETIEDIKSIYVDAQIRICRDMTKKNEQVEDGVSLKDKGEVVVVFK